MKTVYLPVSDEQQLESEDEHDLPVDEVEELHVDEVEELPEKEREVLPTTDENNLSGVPTNLPGTSKGTIQQPETDKKKKTKQSQSAEPRITRSKQTQNTVENDLNSDEDYQQQASTHRRSTRQRRAPKLLDDYIVYSTITEPGEPRNFQEAVTGPEAAQWSRAMRSEYGSIMHNNTWELCDLSAGHKPIGCKWVLKKKIEADGSIRYKARLVAFGNLQVKGVNYDETYSPVVRFTSLRILFAYAVKKNLDIRHLDVQTAFLHGDLQDEVYMQQPRGFVQKGDETKVCHLKKAIYGLKQGSRSWNQKLDQAFKDMNLQ